MADCGSTVALLWLTKRSGPNCLTTRSGVISVISYYSVAGEELTDAHDSSGDHIDDRTHAPQLRLFSFITKSLNTPKKLTVTPLHQIVPLYAASDARLSVLANKVLLLPLQGALAITGAEMNPSTHKTAQDFSGLFEFPPNYWARLGDLGRVIRAPQGSPCAHFGPKEKALEFVDQHDPFSVERKWNRVEHWWNRFCHQ